MPEALNKPSAAQKAILTAPLRLPNSRWTSDQIAEVAGVSQSNVARTWRKYFAVSKQSELLNYELALAAVQLSGKEFCFAFEIIGQAAQPALLEPAQLMRHSRRMQLQTLLAATLIESETTKLDSRSSFNQLPTDRKYLYIQSLNFDLSKYSEAKKIITNGIEIQSFLLPLVQAARFTSAGNFTQLQHALITWAKSAKNSFTWYANEEFNKRSIITAASKNTPPSIPQVIADQSFEWIVNRIWKGELTAGERITETGLAKGLRTTRNQAVDALRTLASSGLIDHHPSRGYLVPTPSAADIAEVYAARRLIGSEILTRVISNPKIDVSPIKASLDQLVSLAKTGNSYETGNADMLLQNTLAQISGLRNYPQIFSTLAKQLQIYIAILGLSYFYPIEGMVSDDTAIYRSIKERNLEGAINAWNKKIDDSLGYMTSRVIDFK